jgi:hypothetical protein
VSGTVDPLELRERLAKIRASYAGMAIPLLVVLVSTGYAFLQNRIARAEREAADIRAAEPACFDQLVAVVDAKAAMEDGGQGIAALDRAREKFILLAAKAEATCKRAAWQLPPTFGASLRAAGIAVQEPGLRQVAAETAASLAAETEPGEDSPALQERGGTPGPATEAPAVPITLYIQIADEAQRAPARALAARLEGQAVAGRPVTVPGVELVARPPAATDLRCLKPDDCAINAALAEFLGKAVDRPVKPVSLAARFGTDPAVRPGTFELWFAADGLPAEGDGG